MLTLPFAMHNWSKLAIKILLFSNTSLGVIEFFTEVCRETGRFVKRMQESDSFQYISIAEK